MRKPHSVGCSPGDHSYETTLPRVLAAPVFMTVRTWAEFDTRELGVAPGNGGSSVQRNMASTQLIDRGSHGCAGALPGRRSQEKTRTVMSLSL